MASGWRGTRHSYASHCSDSGARLILLASKKKKFMIDNSTQRRPCRLREWSHVLCSLKWVKFEGVEITLRWISWYCTGLIVSWFLLKLHLGRLLLLECCGIVRAWAQNFFFPNVEKRTITSLSGIICGRPWNLIFHALLYTGRGAFYFNWLHLCVEQNFRYFTERAVL